MRRADAGWVEPRSCVEDGPLLCTYRRAGGQTSAGTCRSFGGAAGRDPLGKGGCGWVVAGWVEQLAEESNGSEVFFGNDLVTIGTVHARRASDCDARPSQERGSAART